VNNVVFEHNRFDTISGAAIYVRNCSHIRILHNTIVDTQWYSINLDHAVTDSLIFDNVISGTRSMCRYWGGSINLAGNNSAGESLERIIITKNRCYGVHSYGNVIVVNSSSSVLVDGNITRDITSGVAVAEIRHIWMQTEAILPTTTHAPCVRIDVINNELEAGGADHRAIYASNNGGSTYATGLIISGNHIYSPDSDHYFMTGITVHGQSDGYRNIGIANNYVEVLPQESSPGGAIGLIATDTDGWVYDVNVKNNFVKNIAATPSQTYEIGLYVGTYVNRLTLGGNHWLGFQYAVRKFTGSGAEFFGLEDDMFSGNTYISTTEVIPSLTLNTTNPSVANGRIFKTNANQATVINNFTNGVQGQTIKVIVVDAYTTFDFTSSYLKGNVGADWTPAVGDHLLCTYYNTTWYCNVSDNTA
jgi:hypothetical protein